MLITVTATSTDDQLTTTEAVKERLGLSLTATSEDDYLDSIISRASRWAETYIGRGPLTAQSYREALSGYGGRRMPVSRRPVRAITGLWDATDTGQATTVLSSEFSLDREAGHLEREEGWYWDAPGVPRPHAIPLSPSFYPGEERRDWLSDYVAGWTYAGIDTGSDNWSTEKGTTSTGRTLPYDVEDAVIQKAADIYEDDDDVVFRAVGDLRLRYATNSDGMPVDRAAMLLDPYREVA